MNINVNDFMLHYPQISQSGFQKEINEMYEFYSLKLEPKEPLSEKKGVYLRHQEMARRLVNNQTPFQSMLFEHEPGTGKTCIITAISEWNISERQRLVDEGLKTGKKMTKEGYENASRRPIIFVANRAQEHTLSKVISKNCLPDKYLKQLDEDDEFLTSKQKTHKLEQLVARDYRFETLQKFANQIVTHKNGKETIEALSDKIIIDRYSDRLLIIDEAHHLRITNDKKEEEGIIYRAFWRLLHVAKNIKVILLTGTPESDKAEDFAYLMNLILPENEQLNIKNYNQIMFNKETNDLTENGKKLLIKAIVGRVSYLRATPEQEADITEKGQVNPWKEGEYEQWKDDTGYDIPENTHPWTMHTKIVPLRMSEFQENIVREAELTTATYIKKKKGETMEVEGAAGGAFSSFEKDASVIVWPDKTYGPDGFKKI